MRGRWVCVFAIASSACHVAQAPVVAPPEHVSSNTLATDYAGSSSCEPCHAEIFAAWQHSPMHRMTRNFDPSDARAKFEGSFRFKADEVRFDARGGERWMHLSSPERGEHDYRVTRVIGGRYREDFVGVEPASGSATEWVLPVSWVYATSSYRAKGDSVMNRERPGLSAGPKWSATCVDCHNTVPYLSVMLGELYGKGAPGFQGELVDRLLPPKQRWSNGITDEAEAARAIDGEVHRLGATIERSPDLHGALKHAIEITRDRTTGDQLLEVGIGCESCHSGSAEHVASPSLLPSYLPRAAFLSVQTSQGHEPGRAEQINRTCARCHQVLFSRYPYTWEGGERARDPGGSSINSGEARDFLLGGCSGALACTACHDPHREDTRDEMRALATPAGNTHCTGCHATYATADALRAHAKHDPLGAGGACIACHMPRKNTGLGDRLTRYHRIGSPTDAERVLQDRPLECAICHGDKSVEWLTAEMERLWDKRFDRTRLRALDPDLDADALTQTVTNGKGHEQIAAIAMLGERHEPNVAPLIRTQLSSPYPLVAHYAEAALRALDAGIEPSFEK